MSFFPPFFFFFSPPESTAVLVSTCRNRCASPDTSEQSPGPVDHSSTSRLLLCKWTGESESTDIHAFNHTSDCLYRLSTTALTGCTCFQPHVWLLVCAFNQRFDWLYMLSTIGLTGYTGFQPEVWLVVPAFNHRFDRLYVLSTRGLIGYTCFQPEVWLVMWYYYCLVRSKSFKSWKTSLTNNDYTQLFLANPDIKPKTPA